jgi:hypothetical protein
VTWLYILVGAIVALALTVKVVRMVGLAGDLVSVPIPRSGPLKIGTRIEVAAALKKAGANMADLGPLIDAHDDEELLRRYWELKDEEDDP